MAEALNTKLLLKNVRFSYAHVFTPIAISEGAEKKYSVAILIPKENADNKAKLDEVISALKAQVMAEPKNKGKLPKNFDICLRDGDVDKDDEVYAGQWFLNAKSGTAPGVVGTEKDENGKPKPLTSSEFKSGDYGHVTVNLFAYDKAGKTGIAAGLNNIMKTKDGPALSGRASAADDFSEIEVEAEDDMV